MPRITPLSPEEAPQEAHELFERFRRERGNVPNMFRTLALRPEIMSAFVGAMTAVLNTGTLSLQLKERVAVRVSQLNGCHY